MIRSKLRPIKPKYVVRLIAAALTFFIMSSALPVFAYNFPYGEGDYSECPYSADTANCDISITNNGFSLFLNVTPSVAGSCTVQNDQVTVSTYDPYGYSLALNDEATTSNLLQLSGGSGYINYSTGTLALPVALTNSWGYRVDGAGGFGSVPTTGQTNGAPNSAVHFAEVQPSTSTPDTIASTSSLSSPTTTNVWYGVCLDDSVATTPGNYTSTVLY